MIYWLTIVPSIKEDSDSILATAQQALLHVIEYKIGNIPVRIRWKYIADDKFRTEVDMFSDLAVKRHTDKLAWTLREMTSDKELKLQVNKALSADIAII